MHRLRVVLAVAVLAGGISVLGLASPDCAYACSCMMPEPIATYGDDPDAQILSGTVTTANADFTGTFHVDRWFKGSSEVSDIPIVGGDGASCGVPLAEGQELVLVAYVADGVLQTSLCSPFGDLSTPEGQQLRADAIAAFGEGTPPDDAASPEPGSPTGAAGGGVAIPGIVVYGGAAILAIIGLIAVASIVSGRRE